MRDCILGIDSLSAFGFVIDAAQRVVAVRNQTIPYQDFELDLSLFDHRSLHVLKDEYSINPISSHNRQNLTTVIGAGISRGHNVVFTQNEKSYYSETVPQDLTQCEIDEKIDSCTYVYKSTI